MWHYASTAVVRSATARSERVDSLIPKKNIDKHYIFFYSFIFGKRMIDRLTKASFYIL